jgi:hypothetical protein
MWAATLVGGGTGYCDYAQHDGFYMTGEICMGQEKTPSPLAGEGESFLRKQK